MSTILFVRIKSNLDIEELERRAIERRPRFKEVPGLIQKFYARDEASGEVCGIYIFKDKKSVADYRDSELAKTIPSAYEATSVVPQVLELMFPLYTDRGPVAE